MVDKTHSENKHKTALSIKKARGIVDKVFKMTEEEAYCMDIIQQIDAARGLLESAKKSLLTGHLYHCLEEQLKTDKNKALFELSKAFNLK